MSSHRATSPTKSCPVCSRTFPHGFNASDMTAHVNRCIENPGVMIPMVAASSDSGRATFRDSSSATREENTRSGVSWSPPPPTINYAHGIIAVDEQKEKILPSRSIRGVNNQHNLNHNAKKTGSQHSSRSDFVQGVKSPHSSASSQGTDSNKITPTNGQSSSNTMTPTSIGSTPAHREGGILGNLNALTVTRGAAASNPNEQLYESLVQISIYDMNKDGVIGIFHTGIVVFNEEWSYGGDAETLNMPDGPEKKRRLARSGVFWTAPRTAMPHLKKVIDIGYVAMSERERKYLFKSIEAEWPVAKYNLLKCNCNHFTQHLLKEQLVRFCVAPRPNAALTYAESDEPKDESTDDLPSNDVVAPTNDSLRSASSPLPNRHTNMAPAPTILVAYAKDAVTGGLIIGERSTVVARKWTKRFRVPTWVNRSARMVQAVCPDFVYKRVVKRLAPPAPSPNASPTLPSRENSSDRHGIAAAALPTSAAPPGMTNESFLYLLQQGDLTMQSPQEWSNSLTPTTTTRTSQAEAVTPPDERMRHESPPPRREYTARPVFQRHQNDINALCDELDRRDSLADERLERELKSLASHGSDNRRARRAHDVDDATVMKIIEESARQAQQENDMRRQAQAALSEEEGEALRAAIEASLITFRAEKGSPSSPLQPMASVLPTMHTTLPEAPQPPTPQRYSTASFSATTQIPTGGQHIRSAPPTPTHQHHTNPTHVAGTKPHHYDSNSNSRTQFLSAQDMHHRSSSSSSGVGSSSGIGTAFVPPRSSSHQSGFNNGSISCSSNNSFAGTTTNPSVASRFIPDSVHSAVPLTRPSTSSSHHPYSGGFTPAVHNDITTSGSHHLNKQVASTTTTAHGSHHHHNAGSTGSATGAARTTYRILQ